MREEFNLNKNSFDIIRLIAAFQVLTGHYLSTYEISIGKIPELLVRMFPGVLCLFAISGFLISTSLDRSKSSKEYLKKRLLRIYPALWVNIICSILIIGFFIKFRYPIIQFLKWIVLSFIGISYTPSFLKQYATGSVNGSLWSIFVELQFYIILLFIYKYLRKMNNTTWLFIIGFLFSMNILIGYAEMFLSNSISIMIGRTAIPFLCFFIFGSYCYCFRERVIPFLVNNFWSILLIYFGWRLFNLYYPISIPYVYANPINGILVPCIILGAAYKFGNHKLKVDLSYGIYLYHMVIINVMVELKITASVSNFILTLLITIILAMFSWFVIEKPLMKRKNRI